MRRMRRIGAVLAAVVAVSALAGCAPAEPHELPAVDRTVAAGAKDRPIDEVRAASAALDPCALLDPAVSAELGITAEPEARMFSCVLEDHVEVETFVAHSQESRFWQERVEIGGAAAYRSSAQLQICDILLPTSFGTAIQFSQRRYGAPYDCTEAQAFADAAVAALQDDPDSLRRSEDGDALIACDVFEEAVGEAPEGTTFRDRNLLSDGLDSCGLWDDPDGAGFQAVEPRSSLWLVRRVPLAEFSSRGGWQQNEKRQVAGREVMLDPDSNACDVFFDVRSSAEVEGEVIGAVVRAEDCDAAADLVARLLPLLGSAAPATADAAGMLFAAGESDSPAVGACVDAADQEDRACTPFVETEVPGPPAERLSRGVVDANVLCALAADAVRARLGDDLEPVTVIQDDRPACEFVAPDHAVVVRIAASLDDMPGQGDQDFAGHAASVETTENENARTAWIAYDEPDEPGHLIVEVLVGPSRVDGPFTTSPIDDGPLASFDLLASAIAAAVLGD